MFISKSMCPGSSKAATGISFRDKSNLQKASKTLTPTTAKGCQQLQERLFQYNPMAIDQLQVQWFDRLRLLMFWGAKGMENMVRMDIARNLWTGLRRQADRLHAGPNDVTWCLSKGMPLAVQRHASNTWCWRCHTTWTWIHWQVLLGYLGYRTIQVLIPHMPIWWKNVNLIFGGLKMWTRINTLDGCKHHAHIAVKQRSRIASSDSVPACSKQASPDALRW